MSKQNEKRPIWVWVIAVIAVAFGLLTIKSGGSVILIDGEARKAAGDYVGFVVWFNFLAGFFYIVSGLGIWLMQRWAAWLAVALAAATLVTFAAFGFHIAYGGAYETRTVAAMTVRSTLWVVIGAVAARAFLAPARD